MNGGRESAGTILPLCDFVESSAKAHDVESLFGLYQKEMASFGYDRLLFALMNDHPSLKRQAEHGLVRNYPESWVRHYMEKGYDAIDPVRHQAFVRTGSFSWQEITDRHALSAKQSRMFAEAREAELHGGIGISLRGHGGAIAGMGAASSDVLVQPEREAMDMMYLLSMQFYSCFWRLMEQAPLSDQPVLTLREQEVLKWSAVGLPKKEIALRLNLSVHSIDYHVRNVMRKTGCRNITSTVVYALTRGLIQL